MICYIAGIYRSCDDSGVFKINELYLLHIASLYNPNARYPMFLF